jgi:hypothetical protein
MTDDTNSASLRITDFVARFFYKQREQNRTDFNGDILNLGDEVVFAFAASSLRHGIVVGLPGVHGTPQDRIELRSTKTDDTMKVKADACIKVPPQ